VPPKGGIRFAVVYNNAGILPPRSPAWTQPLRAWDLALDVMVRGTVHGVRTFVPILLEAGGGHVVNTASIGGLAPLPQLSPYATAKHAIVGLTETLAVELRDTEVGTTVICPGYVPTNLARTTAELLPSDVGAPALEPAVRRGTGETVDDVARATLAGIEADALHVLVAVGDAEPARARIGALAASLPPFEPRDADG
jgi:NAD(P)-dependent dehydrogenase (short-subunit alcohol dehydrogenase family)